MALSRNWLHFLALVAGVMVFIAFLHAISGADSALDVTRWASNMGQSNSQGQRPAAEPEKPLDASLGASSPPPPKQHTPPPAPEPEPEPARSWYDIAKEQGTDKVTDHEYQYMYEKYLPPLRNKPVKMLEIGLGCNMNYGPGKSYYTWLEYFPNVDLYFIEYNGKCAEKWADKTANAHIFTGDQANVTFLEDFMAQAGEDFDFIIDDGGHTMTQQITSLETLWRAVKPGGYYFLEDLQTSYMQGYGGDPTTKNKDIVTATKFIYELIDDRMTDGTRHSISKDMRSLDCMREVCMFTKKKLNDAW